MASERQVVVGGLRRRLRLAFLLLAVGAWSPCRSTHAQSDARPTSIFDLKWLQNHPEASSPPPAPTLSPSPQPVAQGQSSLASQPAIPPAAVADVKVAPPDPATIGATQKVVREVFADDFSIATTPELKTTLAAKLLDTGQQTRRDLTARYVLCSMARDVSCQTGDATAALRTIDVIAQSYLSDPWTMRTEALTRAATGSHSSEPGTLAELIATTMEQAAAVDRFDAARKLGALALELSKGGADLNLRRSILARVTAVKEAEALSVTAKAADAVLANKPADPQANLDFGRYRCFAKDDWAGGLPFLVNGNDAALKAAAEKEIANPSDLLGQLQMGDTWWDIAGKMKDGLGQRRTREHAAYWYKKIEPQLTELTKARVDKRLKQLEPAPSVRPPTYADLDAALNDFTKWKPGRGIWEAAPDGFTGSGVGSLDFTASLPPVCTLEFNLIILDGLRPRIFFYGTGVYLANEGDGRTMSVYRQHTEGIPMPEVQRLSYALNERMAVKAVFNQDTYQISVNGHVIGRGPRPENDKIGIGILCGDDWSAGKLGVGGFQVSTVEQGD